MEEVPNLLANVWYLHEGTLCGAAEDLQTALDIIEEMGPSRGLYLNRHKPVLFNPDSDGSSANPFPLDNPVVHDGFVLLGSSIKSPSFCDLYI